MHGAGATYMQVLAVFADGCLSDVALAARTCTIVATQQADRQLVG